MIEFHSQSEFQLKDEVVVRTWLSAIIQEAGFAEGRIQYIFCDDDYLLRLNIDYLQHDTLTDIITFDYSIGKEISAEVYISIDRITENAATYQSTFTDELHRVMAHGVLHCIGYKDKTEEEKILMREKENLALKARSFA